MGGQLIEKMKPERREGYLRVSALMAATVHSHNVLAPKR